VGNQGSDTFSIGGYGTGTNANTTSYADTLSLTGTGGTLLSNYSISYIQGGLTIGKANLTATGSKVYDAGTAFAGTNFTSIAGVNGETFTATGSGTLASPNVQSSQALQSLGTLSLVGVSGALASNYNWTTASTSVSVTPRTLTVTGANNTVTYSGVAQTNTGATIVGNQGSDTFSIGGYGTGTNASTTAYADSLSLTGTGGTLLSNYSISYTQGGLTIGKASATVTANSDTLTYNAQTQSITGFTASGLVNGETTAVLTGVTTSGGSGLNASSYTHTASGTDGNYNLSFVTGQLRIARRDITLTGLTAADKTFDGNSTASITGASFGNLVPGQTLGLSGAGAFNDAQVGNNKTVTVTEVANLTQDNGTGRWQNYNLTTSGSFTTLASIRAAAPGPGPNPSKDENRPDWPKVERLNRRPADHLLAQPNNPSAYALAQEDPNAKGITVRGCGAGQEPEWRDSCLPISPSYTARYN
jgi:hypothetical protein